MDVIKTVKISAAAATAATVTAVGAKAAVDIKNKKFCPICEVKKIAKKARLSQTAKGNYNNGAALTPPMGWSSWNLFATHISEDLMKEIAVAMEKSGLRDAGYIYVNIDDCWQASSRDANGKLACDKQTFPHGIRHLSDFMNEHGMKLGLYSSNGTYTCEDYPASLRNEATDADSLAEWGVEYFKYDFCHNVPISNLAPTIGYIEIADEGGNVVAAYKPSEVRLSGQARIIEDDYPNNPSKTLIVGLCSNNGSIEFDLNAPKSGDYALTLTVKKETDKNDKFIIADTGEEQYHIYSVASRSGYNGYRRVQGTIHLGEGANTVKLYNPVGSRFDSAALQYKLMGKELKRATKEYAQKNGVEERPIVYSICEWGFNKPYKWGREAGNLWRTTLDIRAEWKSILAIYEHNVKLYKYAAKGAWNDPDMLEVGNGKLTYDENKAHFALWCMMCSPLILGNDVRAYVLEDGSVDESNKILQLLKNKDLISINQDELGVQAHRIKSGMVDVLAKPLTGGRTAFCVFNKSNSEKSFSLDYSKLSNHSFIDLQSKNSYEIYNVWEQSTVNSSKSAGTLKPHSVEVFIVK